MSHADRNTDKERNRRARRKKLRPFYQIGLLFVSIFLVGFLINNFLITSFTIPSDSMNNTVRSGDGVIVERLTPNIISANRGDIIVFHDPSNWINPNVNAKGSGFLLKRIIAVGGDTISCAGVGFPIVVNGKSISEPYLLKTEQHSVVAFKAKVPIGYVWVMGDNRGNSRDSRYQGNSISGKFVPLSDIVGKVWFIGYPFNHLRFF